MGSYLTWRALGVAIVVPPLLAAPALAGDWSISAVSKTELNIAENRALRQNSLGTSLAMVSDLEVNFDYAMPDGSFNLSTDLRSLRFFGEAKEDGKNDYLPHIGMTLLKTGRRDSVTFSADYRFANVTVQDVILSGDPLAEPLFIPVDTVRETLSAGVNWVHKVDRQNTLTIDNTVTATEFSSSVGIDNLRIESTLGWERTLSNRTRGSLTAGVNWLSLDNAANTNRVIYSLDGELVTRLSKRLTATVGAGVDFTDTLVDGPDPDDVLTGAFDIALDYQMKRTKLGFTAEYGIVQGALGDFQNQLATAVSVAHTINERSSISATARLVLAEDGFDGGLGSDYTFSFDPTYTLALTKEWTMKAGYRFIRKDADTAANSNTVFVSMTRDFVILP